MERIAAAALITFALAGCGVRAKVDARHDMQASKIAYKQCLLAHPKPEDVGACDSALSAFEVDASTYRTFSAGSRPGYASSMDINDDH